MRVIDFEVIGLEPDQIVQEPEVVDAQSQKGQHDPHDIDDKELSTGTRKVDAVATAVRCGDGGVAAGEAHQIHLKPERIQAQREQRQDVADDVRHKQLAARAREREGQSRVVGVNSRVFVIEAVQVADHPRRVDPQCDDREDVVDEDSGEQVGAGSVKRDFDLATVRVFRDQILEEEPRQIHGEPERVNAEREKRQNRADDQRREQITAVTHECEVHGPASVVGKPCISGNPVRQPANEPRRVKAES